MQGQHKIAPISTRLPLTKITTTNFQAVKRRSEDAASSELDRKKTLFVRQGEIDYFIIFY